MTLRKNAESKDRVSVQVNDYYEDLEPETVKRVIQSFRNGEALAPGSLGNARNRRLRPG